MTFTSARTLCWVFFSSSYTCSGSTASAAASISAKSPGPAPGTAARPRSALSRAASTRAQ